MGIQQAYQWAINKCNEKNIGYSQDYRNQQTVNGITYYDCSSFINYSLLAGGYSTPSYAPSNNAFTTGVMGAELTKLGAVKMSPYIAWQAGDILVAHNTSNEHTEMVYKGGEAGKGGITMGAHSSSKPLNEQVSINTYISSPSSPILWDALYRFDGGEIVVPEWIKGNRYLSLEEMKNNAIIIYYYFISKGWTINAIAGMLGNMESESTINPHIWENLSVGSGGYGLTQWTPASKYIDWAGSNWENPDRELDRIQWEVDNNQQWFSNPNAPTTNPPVSFKQYTQSLESVETLANYFLWYYEHPAQTIQPNRATQAKAWYNYLLTIPDIKPTKRKKMPVWMLTKPTHFIIRR